MNLSSLQKNNAGIKFLLTAICSFTKKAWVFPLKNKSAEEVLIGFKTIIGKANLIPHRILSDSGKELRNNFF